MDAAPHLLTDHLGRQVQLTLPARRIVSLCPSQTETLYAIGAGPRVVGATQWCIHPAAELAAVPRVGGTKKVNLRRVAALAPDLVIGEKEENTPEMVAALAGICPVYVTDVTDTATALRMVASLGLLTGCQTQATVLARQIATALTAVPRLPRPLRVAYLIWQDPWMAAGASTYIHSVLGLLGFHNVFAGEGSSRYPQFDLARLQALSPDVVLLSSEPYSFGTRHQVQLSAQLPGTRILLADGEVFSWYGARMLHLPACASQLLAQLR